MSTNWKFAVPLAMGLAAAALNWWSMSDHEQMAFIAVRRAVEPGQILGADDFEAAPVPKKLAGSLDRLAIPFHQHGVLDNNPIQRRLAPGDLLTFRDLGQSGPKENLGGGEEAYLLPLRGVPYDPDILFVGDCVSFLFPSNVGEEAAATERIGPFRVVSIGARFNRDQSSEQSGTVDQIGIAVPKDAADPRRRLAETLLSHLARSSSDSGQNVFLVLHKDEPAVCRPKE